MLLLGDIGATWAKLALVASRGDGATGPAAEATLAGKAYGTLEELVTAFLHPIKGPQYSSTREAARCSR